MSKVGTDAFDATERLIAGGFDEAQAEAIIAVARDNRAANGIDKDNLATKDALDAAMAPIFIEFETVHREIRDGFAMITEGQVRELRWVIGGMIGILGIAVAILR